MTYIRKVIGVIPPCPCPNGEGSDSSTEQVSEAITQATHSLRNELSNLGESNTRKFGSKLKRKVIGKTYDGPKGSNTPPKMDADTPVVGTENAFARGDHQHPHDTTKADVTALVAEKKRAEQAETALGNRITTNSNAINAEKQRAQLKEQLLQQNINTESQRAQEAEQQLRALYQALTETETIPVSELPATGETNKIYRVAGDGNYSDYMWNGTAWVLMATYDNDIDEEPTPGSNNLVKSGGVAGMYGHYTDNPEFLYVMTDIKQRILLALRKDGQVMFGAGVPYQVKEYVDAKIAEIFGDEDLTEKIDSLKEIVAFLENLKNSDKLKQMLDMKVDKEEGKSLIDADYAESVSYIDNQEWAKLLLTEDNRIIFGIRKDGSVDWSVGVPNPVQKYVDNAIKKIYENGVLDSFKYVSNPEYLLAVTDNEGHFLFGVTVEGVFRAAKLELPESEAEKWLGEVYSIIEDPEDRLEITLDKDKRVLGYREKDGTRYEEKFKTNHLSLTSTGMTEFQQALKDAGFNPGGTGDWSDAKSLEIPKPRLAFVNFVNPNGETTFPQSKFVDFNYLMEFYDGTGNYFKKEVIFNAQGQSSMGKPKKNGAIDICNNNGWDDEDTFELKIGDWVPQDSFHIKAYYSNIFKGEPVVGYQIADIIQKSRGILKDRPWKVGLLGNYTFTDNSDTSDVIDDMSLQMDNGARCMPDGFPCIVFLDGDFYGIYSWQLKKHRDNYHMGKSNKNHIHLDGVLGNESIFAGAIDWTQFEIRNPKSLCYQELHNGSYKYDADVAQDEIAGIDKNYEGDWSTGNFAVGKIVKHLNNYFINMIEDNTNEPVLSSGSNKNTASSPDFKNKTNCGWVNCTTSVSVKSKIIALSNRCDEITNASTDEERKELINSYFDKENLIDYILFSQITGNYDGADKNWQWVTYDGVKWFACTYDLDGLFGCNFVGVFTDPANKTHTYDYLLSQLFNRYAFTEYVISLYSEEISARYSDIRNIGISEDYIISMINSWNLAVGQHYYEKEYDKWPLSECNRDNIINEGWEIVPNTFWGTNPQFDINKTYQIGEECWMSYRKFKATQTTKGVPPYTQLGYHDNIYRISAWLSERFRLLDLYYNYSN